MQMTALNKAVSLFLVGSLVLLMVTPIAWRHLDRALQTGPEKAVGLLVVVGVFFFLALAALLGLVVEAITGFSIRLLVRKSASDPRWAKVFLQRGSFKVYNLWRERFHSVAEAEIPETEFPAQEHGLSLATALFFESASTSLSTWAESHYAAFVLATNLSLIALLFPFYSLLLTFVLYGSVLWVPFFVCLVVGGMFVFCLIILAIDRYLYTFEVTYRQAWVVLWKKRSEKASKPSGDSHITPASSGRVARGACAPPALTEPDLWAHIRLFGTPTFRLAL